MALAGLCFVVYAVVFFGVNLTESFLQLGIGPEQVDKGKAEVEAFSPLLFHYIISGLATIGHLGPVYLAGLIFIVGVVFAVGALRAPTS